jgi:hypothetical protein
MTVPSEHSTPFEGFQADRPRQHPDQDCLGRAAFAEKLAARISAWKHQDSLVIGLEGAWGSGKSTIKNFIMHYLGSGSGVTVVEFNPWQFSGDDRLFEEFAAAIASVLPSNGESDAERKELWTKYASYLSFGGKFSAGLKLAASFSGIPGATVLLDQATQALDSLGDLAKQGADSMDAKQESLQSIKRDLADSFRKLDRPLLVVIDDIDRLTDAEVALIFRLVKANADFPNLVYLLSYDRQYVTTFLDKITSSKGQEFLQKIVQMPIPVPAPQIQRVHGEALACLNRILGGLPESPVSEWNQERWANLWVQGLSHYFTDLRRVYRYVNSCAFLLDNLMSSSCVEIDAMDFLALEVLRIFEKPVYDRIQKAGDLLTGLILNDWERSQFDDLLKALLNSASDSDATKNIVSVLFLKAKGKWENMGYSDSFMQDAAAKMRVCSPDHFPKYFQLALPEGALSQSRVVEVLQNLQSREALWRIFADAIRTEYIVPLLQALNNHNRLDKLEEPLPYLLALCDSVDAFPEKRVGIGCGLLDVHPSAFVMWAVLGCCDGRKCNDEKIMLLERIITESDGLYMPANLLWTWHERTEKAEDGERLPALDEELSGRLNSCILARMKQWADSGQLTRHGLRGSLISFRIRWEPEACRAWISAQLSDHAHASALVSSQLNESSSQTLGSVYRRKREYFDFDWMEKLSPWDEWKVAIERIIGHDPDSEFSKRIKSALDQAERRKAKGLRSADWAIDDE